ncbi:MAG: hypothetical protein QOG45_814 [Chloroflexota bacterium]|nr:hypothetical protein [Chloroflexota bacterium]
MVKWLDLHTILKYGFHTLKCSPKDRDKRDERATSMGGNDVNLGILVILVLILLFVASVGSLHIGHCPGNEPGICISWQT